MIRVIYAGSPQASAITLDLLAKSASSCGYEIVGVLTNPPSAKGRHKTLIPTPVHLLAQELGISVFTPEHLDAECREKIQELSPDILVCFAYGHIFGPKFLNLFRFGGINLHPSALPKYRGCTPVNAAILNGDNETAFSVQKISLKMDEGDILRSLPVVLTKKETAGSLLNEAAEKGVELIRSILEEIFQTGKLPNGNAQTGIPSYTSIIKKEDALLNWNSDSEKIDAFVRGYAPEPGAWCFENSSIVRILEGFSIQENESSSLNLDSFLSAKPGTVCTFIKEKGIIVRCLKGFFSITRLQRQGKNAMDYKSFMNGARDFVGSLLSIQ